MMNERKVAAPVPRPSIGNEPTISSIPQDKEGAFPEVDVERTVQTVGPPDGGIQAWLQVAGAFVLFFNTWGLMNTFGVYQDYYESGKLFRASSSDISWIGSIQAFLILLVGCISGPLFDAGYLRTLLAFGTFSLVFGHMMLSLVTEYWQALLAQGFVIGLGAGCLYVPSFAVSPQYFSTHLVTAMGLSLSGSSLGGIIYPIVFNRLVHDVGFPWAVRSIGFIALGLLLIPLSVMKMRVQPPAKRSIIDKSAFVDAKLLGFMFSGFLGYIGLMIPFFYLPFTSTARGYSSQTLSFYLVPILNTASIFGRIFPAILADRFGSFNMLIPTAAVAAAVAFCAIAVQNFAGIVVIAVLYGFWSGAYIALPPAIFVKLTPPDKRHVLGTRMGMGFCIMGLGLLIGTPVAGALVGPSNNFMGVYAWSGAALAVGCLGFIVIRTMWVGFKLNVRA